MAIFRKQVPLLLLILLVGGVLIVFSDIQRPSPLQASPEKIHVGGWIDSPHIRPDGSELYFMYAPVDIWTLQTKGRIRRGGLDRPGHTTSGDAPEALANVDIYVAKKLPMGAWAVAPVTEINTPEHQECCPYLSWDGRRLYFYRSPIVGGGGGVYVSDRTADGWSDPQPANMPAQARNVSISADGTELLYDADPDDPTASSGKEIWMARKQPHGAWGDFEKLPALVNSSDPSDRQQTPWLSRDRRRLYFHRFKENGSGSQILLADRDAQGAFQSVEAITLTGLPVVADLGSPLIGEPSLTEDEALIYALVLNERAVPEIWFAEKQADGTWSEMKPVDGHTR